MREFLPATDAGAFAEQLLGAPLWDHQLDLVRSPARYRVVCAGRQVGKSRAMAVAALHEATTKRGAVVLLVSAGEVASRRLLEEIAALAAGSPLLRGSVLDETKSELTLSNGARILSVPASIRQIRGWAVDLLILDEAAFVDPEVWRAAEPAIIARPGSRVILASTPWGSPEHFFRMLWRRGLDRPDGMVAAWHWPSTLSPLVDEELVEHWRATWPEHTFRTEVLAEWADGAGAYFSEAELEAAVDDVVPVALDTAWKLGEVWGGVDWAFARDANTLAVLGVRGRLRDGSPVLEVCHVEERFGMPYGQWLDLLVSVTRGAGRNPSHGFAWGALAAETNGVGAYPTQELSARLDGAGLLDVVVPVATTSRTKEQAFGELRVLMATGRLVLPRDPRLLRQLRALEFEQQPAGGLRIAVPESRGHDDLAMALALAVTGMRTAAARPRGGIVPLG